MRLRRPWTRRRERLSCARNDEQITPPPGSAPARRRRQASPLANQRSRSTREPFVAFVVRRLDLADRLLLRVGEVNAGAPDHVLAEALARRAAVSQSKSLRSQHRNRSLARCIEAILHALSTGIPGITVVGPLFQLPHLLHRLFVRYREPKPVRKKPFRPLR